MILQFSILGILVLNCATDRPNMIDIKLSEPKLSWEIFVIVSNEPKYMSCFRLIIIFET